MAKPFATLDTEPADIDERLDAIGDELFRIAYERRNRGDIAQSAFLLGVIDAMCQGDDVNEIEHPSYRAGRTAYRAAMRKDGLLGAKE